MTTELRVVTPNCDDRPGKPIRLIVLHADASPDSAATRSWIQNPKSQVSYHLEVERDGAVVRYVDDDKRAWAVGVAEWNGATNLNSISLSASFANRNDHIERLTDVQVATMKAIVAAWRAKFPTIEAVVTHADVARPVGRKTDPVAIPNFSIDDYR